MQGCEQNSHQMFTRQAGRDGALGYEVSPQNDESILV